MSAATPALSPTSAAFTPWGTPLLPRRTTAANAGWLRTERLARQAGALRALPHAEALDSAARFLTVQPFSWAARRYRTIRFAGILHAIEGAVVLALVFGRTVAPLSATRNRFRQGEMREMVLAPTSNTGARTRVPA